MSVNLICFLTCQLSQSHVLMSLAQPAAMAHVKGLILNQCPTTLAPLAKLLIRDCKTEELKGLCRQCGVSPAGTKANMANRLAQTCGPLPRRPWQIISIDIGIHNFAKAMIQVDLVGTSHNRPRLIEWEKISINPAQTSDPRSMAIMVAGLVERLKFNRLGIATTESHHTEYLIERQTFRGGGNKMIPGIVQKINMIENQLHCFLIREHTICVDPRTVSLLYSFRTGARKKKDAVELVTSLISRQASSKASCLETRLVDLSPEWINFFKGHEKKDDLADALLQALAHYQWRLNMAKLWEKYQPDMEKEIRASEF